jgi:hypothetical protein
MNEDFYVTATFTLASVPSFKLTVTTSGSGEVTLEPSCGTYPSGTQVKLTAVPAAGWSFSAWSGGITGKANPVWLTMTADTTVDAAFLKNSQVPSQPPGGGWSGGGGGGGGTDTRCTTSVAGMCTQEGVFWDDVIAPSADDECKLTIAKGVKVLNANGYPIYAVTVTTIAEPGAAPAGATFIGQVYEITPRGSTIIPSANLTLNYQAVSLPRGVAATNLYVVMFDKETGKWQRLDSTADTANRRVSASITGFSRFALAAGLQPAEFDIAPPVIVPGEAEPGSSISATVRVKNTGDLVGECRLACSLDGEVFSTRTVTVPGGGSEDVEFIIPAGAAGTHSLDINGLSAGFTVLAAPASFREGGFSITPASAGPGDAVKVAVTVVNAGETAGERVLHLFIDGEEFETRTIGLESGQSEEVVFEVTMNDPGTHRVELNGLAGNFEITGPDRRPSRRRSRSFPKVTLLLRKPGSRAKRTVREELDPHLDPLRGSGGFRAGDHHSRLPDVPETETVGTASSVFREGERAWPRPLSAFTSLGRRCHPLVNIGELYRLVAALTVYLDVTLGAVIAGRYRDLHRQTIVTAGVKQPNKVFGG